MSYSIRNEKNQQTNNCYIWENKFPNYFTLIKEKNDNNNLDNILQHVNSEI